MNPNWGPPLVTPKLAEIKPLKTRLDEPLYLTGPDRLVADWFADLRARSEVVRTVVSLVDAEHEDSFRVRIGDTDSGSDYRRDQNLVVMSPKYATNPASDLMRKLVLYRLSCAYALLPLDTRNGTALNTYNDLQTRLWRMANPAPAVDGTYLYQGTNRENYFAATTGIATVGISTKMAGSLRGSKRWEQHTFKAVEFKDQGWTTFTAAYDLALSYAREHTEWALGMKVGEPTMRDVADFGGMVVGFRVAREALQDHGHWRRDNSGNEHENWQTCEDVPANQVEVFEVLAIPGPLTKVAPPPMM